MPEMPIWCALCKLDLRDELRLTLWHRLFGDSGERSESGDCITEMKRPGASIPAGAAGNV